MADTRNWAGNVVFSARSLEAPATIAELQEVVAGAPRLKALGTAHSFSDVADTDGVQVSVARLPRMAEVDTAARQVRVSAGTRWGELAPLLHKAGLALHTLGSLPHISVAGSAATGTHGSGDRNGCLASVVSALEMVTASGELVRLRRGDPDFDGAVVALGALGVVTAMTLAVEPAYEVEQTVYEDMPWAVVLDELDRLMASASSVSVFTLWRDEGAEQVWVKRRTDQPAVDLTWTAAVPADGPRHPVPGMNPVHCTEQLGVAGPWFERIPHFRLGFTPSSGDELQTEFLLPRAQGRAALEAVGAIRDEVAPLVQVSEIRSVAADDLWLSPAYGRATLAIHFTWVPDPGAVEPVVRRLDEVLAPLGARPHWGKVFVAGAATLPARYERLADFQELAARYDPEGKLRNDFLDRTVLAGR